MGQSDAKRVWILSVLQHSGSQTQTDGQHSLPVGQGQARAACWKITT